MDYAYIIHAKHHRVIDVFDDYIHGCGKPFSAHIELRGEFEFALPDGRVYFFIDRVDGVLCCGLELVG